MEKNGSRFEQLERCSIHGLNTGVNQGRQFSEGVDLEVVGLTVLITPQVEFD
jgi:hypothetical protein